MFDVAIIGCGRVAGHHGLSIAKTIGVQLVAVCDLDEEKAAAYGQKFNVPHFVNYRQMFHDIPSICLVAIVTPSGMHAEHAAEVIEEYGKSVIVEKPTFMSPSQLEDVYAIASAKSTEVFPVFQNRHNKAVKKVKNSLDVGELGDIHIVNVCLRWCRPQRYYDMAPWRGTYSHDGGALANQTIHHIDLLRYLGGEVKSVNATMRTKGANIEVEDTTVAILNYQSGALGVLESTTAARPDDFEASLSIVGSKGLAQIGGIAVNELQTFTPDPTQCVPCSEEFESIKGHGAVYGFGHAQVYQDIYNHLSSEKPYPIDREDCLETIRLLHAFYVSDEQGRWIDLEDALHSSRLGQDNEIISEMYRTPRQ